MTRSWRSYSGSFSMAWAMIEEIADRVIQANEKSAADFKAGKQQALGFLVGQMMKESKGKVNPKLANEILARKLGCAS